MTVLSTLQKEEVSVARSFNRAATLDSRKGLIPLLGASGRFTPFPRVVSQWPPDAIAKLFSKVVLNDVPGKPRLSNKDIRKLKEYLLQNISPNIVNRLVLPDQVPSSRTDTHWEGDRPPPYVPYNPFTLPSDFDPAYYYSQQTGCGSAFLSTDWYAGKCNILPTDKLNMANVGAQTQYAYIFSHNRTVRVRTLRITAQLNPALSNNSSELSDHHLSFFGDNWAEGDPSWMVHFYNASQIQTQHSFNAFGEDIQYPGDLLLFWDTVDKLSAATTNYSQITNDGYCSLGGSTEYYPFIPASDNIRQWTLTLPGEGILCRPQDAIVCRTGKTTSVDSQNQLRGLYMNIQFEFVDVPVDTREVQTYTTFEVFPA
jgi:hypothetical protein